MPRPSRANIKALESYTRASIDGPALAYGEGHIYLAWTDPQGRINLRSVPPLDVVAAVARFLGTINLALAAFNLLPGFPLDGGRVLRSIIWAVRGDRAKATPIAARGGQLVAGLFVLWGVAQYSEGDALWFWPLLLAYFLYNAATGSMRQERLGGLVAGTHVAPLMNTSFVPADPRATVATVVRDIMLPRNLRAVPVVADQSFLGLMTSDDVRKVDHDRWGSTPIEQVMTPSASLAKLAPEDDLGEALARLDRDGVISYIRMRDQFAQGR